MCKGQVREVRKSLVKLAVFSLCLSLYPPAGAAAEIDSEGALNTALTDGSMQLIFTENAQIDLSGTLSVSQKVISVDG